MLCCLLATQTIYTSEELSRVHSSVDMCVCVWLSEVYNVTKDLM